MNYEVKETYWAIFLITTLAMARSIYGSPFSCESPGSLRDTLNLGSTALASKVINNINSRGFGTFLFLGGSITAMGYHRDFSIFVQKKFNITSFNRGHGACDSMYTLYCVDIHDINPDVVFVDFGVNEASAYSPPMEALIRRVGYPDSVSQPLVVLVNFITQNYKCNDEPKFLDLAHYYNIPFVDLCHSVHHCFPEGNFSLYSKDGIHPFGPEGVSFLGKLFSNWWLNFSKFVLRPQGKFSENISTEKPLLFYEISSSSIYDHLFCQTLNEGSIASLEPSSKPLNWSRVERKKKGAKAFQSIKKCWEARTVGAKISFSVYASELKVAVYQNKNDMGVVSIFLDDSTQPLKNITGYFEGYAWAGDKVQGRQEIYSVFGNLPLKNYTVSFVITPDSADPKSHEGHDFQVIALLYSY
jgi:hypothetical protein